MIVTLGQWKAGRLLPSLANLFPFTGSADQAPPLLLLVILPERLQKCSSLSALDGHHELLERQYILLTAVAHKRGRPGNAICRSVMPRWQRSLLRQDAK